MVKKNFLQQHKLFIGAFVALLGLFTILLPASPASAYGCPDVYRGFACNSDEQRAQNACNGEAEGSLWFSNSSDAASSDGYYAIGVNISATDTSTQVFIRGSVYGCGGHGGDWSRSYAVDISPGAGSRLAMTGGSSLFRGQFSGGNQYFTTRGSSLPATLNVSGLAMNNNNGPAQEVIVIPLYRCYSSNGVWATGGCGTTPIPVVVNRARAPAHALRPSITLNSTTAQPGNTLTAQPTVTSEGGGTASNINWRVTRFIVKKGGSYPTTRIENAATPEVHYGNNPSNQGAGVRNFSVPSTTQLAPASNAVEGLDLGDRVCYALSVQPYTNNNALGLWSHSAPACAVVSKSPKVQVLGGDLVVGRATPYNPARVSEVTTSTVNAPAVSTGRYHGSWSEYAIIPSGKVTGTASGSMYAGGATSNALCSLSILTIANNTKPNCVDSLVGFYASGTTAPNVASRFSVSAPAPVTGATVDIRGLTPSQVHGVPASQSNLTITSSSPFPAGRWVVINAPNTTVTIGSNIDYTPGNLTSITDIPQVVIIAKNIIIADSVTNIDSWLIATGSGAEGIINTCGAGGVTQATLPTAAQCGAKLTVNGPLMANHLILRRTAGADAGAGAGANPGDPAEVFNLRADAYVWSSSYSPGTGRIPTVNTVELPPRF